MGASEFCIVLAVRGPDERILARIFELVPLVHDQTGLNVAVSAGILTEDQARRLAEGGVHRYNHNLETARSYFGDVVTTHSWEERAETCRLVRVTGWSCAAGPSSAWARPTPSGSSCSPNSSELEPTEVPINFLNPRPGTPLGDRPVSVPGRRSAGSPCSASPSPSVILRYAGGREVTLRDLQAIG